MSIEHEWALLHAICGSRSLSQIDVRECMLTDPLSRQVYRWMYEHPSEIGDIVDTVLISGVGAHDAHGIINYAGAPQNKEVYARVIENSWRLRQLVSCGIELTDAARVESNNADELWMSHKNKTADIIEPSRKTGADHQGAKVISIDAARRLVEMRAGNTSGIPTSLPFLDDCLCGLLPERLYVIASRTSVGKTALLLQMALHAAHRGYRIGILSLEMTVSELFLRGASNCLNISLSGLMRGNESCFNELQSKCEGSAFCEYEIYYNDRAFDLESCVSQLCRWKGENKIDLGIVDHIGLVEVRGVERRVEQLGVITRKLKLLSKTLEIPIAAACQLNRVGAISQARPDLHQLRESGEIEQNADVVIMLHAPDDEDRSIREIGVLKNRMGKVGWRREAITFTGDHQRLTQ